ncbi:tRNA-dihydrouridine(20) synthase [NAD(P)+]-like [Halotydeus destructor]|nr:tRNA-dihydrouridine(20) synthase [NAD(P)+]-like [Halotydeus destructor]
MTQFSDRYRDKLILAPMVRIGNLPTRLLALRYGADLVYSEETIDWRLLRCKRHVNDVLGTIDYIDEDHNVVFRTCSLEKEKLVLQLGTCDADRALQAAKSVENDVSGIDINMGCPKEFSIKGGMGAALLTQPEKIKDILTKLVNGLSIAVTCKIRLLPNIEDTITLVKMIESTGVAAIGVHGRTRAERPRHSCRIDEIRAVAQAIKIPVIANGGSGDFSSREDIIKFKHLTGASSVMVARAAEKNVSVFRTEGPVELEEVIREHLKYDVHYDMHVAHAKYCILQMLGTLQASEKGQKCLAAQQLKDLCEVYCLTDYFENRSKEIRSLSLKNQDDTNIDHRDVKRLKLMRSESDENLVEMSLVFVRSLFQLVDLPKNIIIDYVRKNHFDKAIFHVKQVEKHFYCEVSLKGKTYRNNYLEKNKKYSEQGAALVACLSLGLIDDLKVKDCYICDAPHERTLNTISR